MASRTIFGIGLSFALTVAVGCGSKPAPTQPAAPEPEPKKEPDAPIPVPVPKVETPKVEVPKIAWELDPTKHAIPNAPLTGTFAGAAFTPVAVLEGLELKFMAGAERQIAITLPRPIDARPYKVHPDDPNSPELPKISTLFPPAAPGQAGGSLFPGSHAFYALTLELGPRKDGKVTGRIYLAFRDESKSALAGTFTADVVRPHTEKPGPDDAPYVAGEVTVLGANPKAEVRVAYATFLTSGVLIKELQIGFDPMPLERASWIRENTDKPRTTTLIPGDGKDRPFRYEHVKLPPGRYLFLAVVTSGPAVWKWVDVPTNGALTENFTLDVSKTGALEVAAPPDATGKVFIAPADDAARPALDDKLFEVLSLQVLRTDVDVVAGKAVVKNLGAGKYEVRLGGERRIVEVLPGKTAEVNMTPAKK